MDPPTQPITITDSILYSQVCITVGQRRMLYDEHSSLMKYTDEFAKAKKDHERALAANKGAASRRLISLFNGRLTENTKARDKAEKDAAEERDAALAAAAAAYEAAKTAASLAYEANHATLIATHKESADKIRDEYHAAKPRANEEDEEMARKLRAQQQDVERRLADELAARAIEINRANSENKYAYDRKAETKSNKRNFSWSSPSAKSRKPDDDAENHSC